MKAFLDVNVFVDVLERREGWKASIAMVRLVRAGRIQGYISALTPPILYFLRARISSEEEAKEDAKRVIEGFRIVPLSEEIISLSFDEKRMGDFEDSIQFYSAKPSSEVLITRNKKDFRAVENEIEVLTPEEFLEKYKPIP
ncbi:MAG: PIN domain-containing protein [Candidatus Freyarchaeota archaeon]|nr:PIN domain-containing protein [Candidatus Jordarchaeia archaeon]MBS7268085.1 PIN domain-containing protein [Candidatus Jordarchaeia archaeon]MBS7279084.1 PIN domain-containing protein [Candidatus Jordarchaeia archaeon]